MYMAKELDAGDVIRAAKTAIDRRGGRAGADRRGWPELARRRAGRGSGAAGQRHGRAYPAGPQCLHLRADAEHGALALWIGLRPAQAAPRPGAGADPLALRRYASWAGKMVKVFPTRDRREKSQAAGRRHRDRGQAGPRDRLRRRTRPAGFCELQAAGRQAHDGSGLSAGASRFR